MKLREVIEKIDISDNDNGWIDFEVIAEDLNLGWEEVENIDWNKNDKLRSEYITCHLCTDTWVGVEAYFLNGEVACITKQDARKSPKVILGWTSEEIAQKTREYIKSISIDPSADKNFDIIDLDQELGDSYEVDYAEQLMHKNVIHKNEICKVIEKPRLTQDGKSNHYEIIVNKAGTEQIVDVRDIKIPFVLDGKFNKHTAQ